MKNLLLLVALLFFCCPGMTAAHPHAAPQQTEQDQKQLAKETKRRVELERRSAAERQKREAKENKEMLKMRDLVSTNGIGERALIELQLRDRTKVSGWVSQLSMTEFVINERATGAARTLLYRDVAKVKGKNPAAKKKGKSAAMTVLDML